MIIHQNFPLKEYNSFGIEAYAAYFTEFYDMDDILEFQLSEFLHLKPQLILGGGSNLLFTSDFSGLVIHSAITDLENVKEDEQYVYVKAGSGVIWDELVEYATSNNLGGIENLSDIPGLVGAAPVQNIGAYGTEAANTIYEVHAWDFKQQKLISLNNKDCKFGYRYSIFKEESHKYFFITHVVFRLTKNPKLETSYGPVESELKKFNERNIRTLRQAIINIRRSKLPPTNELPSAGSFFKNPVLKSSQAEELLKTYPDMPIYPQPQSLTKVPAAWLIEQSGLKGIRKGAVGTYPKQPLVIVNYGSAKGQEIVQFSNYIREKVNEKFSIELEPEVCFI